MKLIVGLGNPGPRYADSRHNVGFMTVDLLARRHGIDVSKAEKRFEAIMGDGSVAGQRCLLVKPQTYMNLSGKSVGAVLRFYKLPPTELFVAYDDLDLPVGALRLRATGSAGGHNGMGDVLRCLGTQDVARARLGIGKVHKAATVNYVLGAFSREERETMEITVQRAADAVEHWIANGIESAMNAYNRKERGPGESGN